MKGQNHGHVKVSVSQVLDHCGRRLDAQDRTQAYRAPQLFVIGAAVDLVQGYSYGKYSDGYTGYYWER